MTYSWWKRLGWWGPRCRRRCDTIGSSSRCTPGWWIGYTPPPIFRRAAPPSRSRTRRRGPARSRSRSGGDTRSALLARSIAALYCN